MGRRRREDVATVERAADGRQTVGGLLQNMRRYDAPEPLGGRQEQPVVRSDEVVATTGP